MPLICGQLLKAASASRVLLLLPREDEHGVGRTAASPEHFEPALDPAVDVPVQADGLDPGVDVRRAIVRRS